MLFMKVDAKKEDEKEPAKTGQLYSFPELEVSVYAKDLQEATKMAREQTKKATK